MPDMKAIGSLVFVLILHLFTLPAKAQLPRGDRTLAWQIDLAENNNYDSAFAYGYSACMESVHLFFKWTDAEPDTGVFNGSFISSFLDVVDIYYPAWNMEVELQIAPTNTGTKEVPTEFRALPFDHPSVINRFKILLDTVFAHIPHVTLSALNIGNESDLNFGTDGVQYDAFKVFLDSAASHAKRLYFQLHGTDLKVGTTFTHHGLVDPKTAHFCQSVNAGLDIVSVTYYPLQADFTMKDPSVVPGDFGALVAAYPDTSQPIYFVECGFASSSLCNSSETLQADFWRAVFAAWDTYRANIAYLTIFKSTDWSSAVVNQLGQYYGLQDTVFKEYLRTLGVRTWAGDGTDKAAYTQIQCELAARNWCQVTCPMSSVSGQFSAQPLSVYPNPADKEVFFEFAHQPEHPYSLHLYTINGQLVRTRYNINRSFVLEREGLHNGIYFYYLYRDHHTFTAGKIVFK